jgi:hypothetical protein
MVKGIVCFARKRGYKSLFGDDDDSNDGQQNMYRFSREDFFLALEGKLQNEIIDGESRNEVLSICERILNRDGLRRNEGKRSPGRRQKGWAW